VTFEFGLLKALNLLASMSHDIVMADMDVFFSSLVGSSVFESSENDQYNLDELRKIREKRDEVEKIQRTMTTEHPGVNSFSVHYENYRAILNQIQFRSNAVTELEGIVDGALEINSEEYRSAKMSIIGAYRSCRESYITVDSMINVYNEHNQEHQLSRLRIPKEVALPS